MAAGGVIGAAAGAVATGGVVSLLVLGGVGAGAVSGAVGVVASAGVRSAAPLVSVLVRAPPELLTVAGGLVLPGAVTVVEVSEGEALEESVLLVEVEDVLVEVWARPELLTTLVGDSSLGDAVVLSVEVPVSAGVDSDVEDDVEVSVLAGSAVAMPGTPDNVAPTPSAAARTPTRPTYSA